MDEWNQFFMLTTAAVPINNFRVNIFKIVSVDTMLQLADDSFVLYGI
jgi:hypothetical protein